MHSKHPFIITDIKDVVLSEQESSLLQHPAIAGVILNKVTNYGPDHLPDRYDGLDGVKQLISSIRAINPNLLIMIDYEGGHIQRISSPDLPSIPYMRDLMVQTSPDEQISAMYKLGREVGQILSSLGIDVLLGPVVDQFSAGNPLKKRAIASDTETIISRARSYIQGLHEERIHCTLKHFPGLGATSSDTHHLVTKDQRTTADIHASMQPFEQLIKEGLVSFVMPSHAIYPQAAPLPATLSPYWLKEQLRKQCGFSGMIITDDTSMKALSTHEESLPKRIKRSKDAGCDLVLVMHQQDALLTYLQSHTFEIENPNTCPIPHPWDLSPYKP